jgi:hypothetical protein
MSLFIYLWLCRNIDKNNFFSKGGIIAMNLKRKVAAALAAVMAFGSVATFNLNAQSLRSDYVGVQNVTTARTAGNLVTRMVVNERMVDNTLRTIDTFGQAGAGVPNQGANYLANHGVGVDLLIPYSLLHSAENATNSFIWVELEGDGYFNWRSFAGAGAGGLGGHRLPFRLASTGTGVGLNNFGFYTGARLPHVPTPPTGGVPTGRVVSAVVSPTASPTPVEVLAPGGTSTNATEIRWTNPSAILTDPFISLDSAITWAGDSGANLLESLTLTLTGPAGDVVRKVVPMDITSIPTSATFGTSGWQRRTAGGTWGTAGTLDAIFTALAADQYGQWRVDISYTINPTYANFVTPFPGQTFNFNRYANIPALGTALDVANVTTADRATRTITVAPGANWGANSAGVQSFRIELGVGGTVGSHTNAFEAVLPRGADFTNAQLSNINLAPLFPQITNAEWNTLQISVAVVPVAPATAALTPTLPGTPFPFASAFLTAPTIDTGTFVNTISVPLANQNSNVTFDHTNTNANVGGVQVRLLPSGTWSAASGTVGASGVTGVNLVTLLDLDDTHNNTTVNFEYRLAPSAAGISAGFGPSAATSETFEVNAGVFLIARSRTTEASVAVTTGQVSGTSAAVLTLTAPTITNLDGETGVWTITGADTADFTLNAGAGTITANVNNHDNTSKTINAVYTVPASTTYAEHVTTLPITLNFPSGGDGTTIATGQFVQPILMAGIMNAGIGAMAIIPWAAAVVPTPMVGGFLPSEWTGAQTVPVGGPNEDTAAVPSVWVSGLNNAANNELHYTGLPVAGRGNITANTNQVWQEIPYTIYFRNNRQPQGHAGNTNWLEIEYDPRDVQGNAYLRVPMIIQQNGPAELVAVIHRTGYQPLRVNLSNVVSGTTAGRLQPNHAVQTVRLTANDVDVFVRENQRGAFTPRDMSTAATTNFGALRGFTLTLPQNYVLSRPDLININGSDPGSQANAIYSLGSTVRDANPPLVPVFQMTEEQTNWLNANQSLNFGRRADGTLQVDIGVPTDVNSTRAATYNPSSTSTFALISANRSELHIFFGNEFSNVGGGAAQAMTIPRQINIQRLTVEHRDLRFPVFSDSVVQFAVRNNNARFSLSSPPHGNNGGVSAAEVDAANFRNFGLSFERTTGAAGEVQEVRAGRVYTDSFTSWNNAQAMPSNINQFGSNVARVTLTEVVADSAWGARDFTFQLTDADGKLLPTAKIAAVRLASGQFQPGNANINVGFNAGGGQNAPNSWVDLHNANPASGTVNYSILGGEANFTGVRPVVGFSSDGHSLHIEGLRTNPGTNNANLNARMWLTAEFYISTDVNWEGDVYLSVVAAGPRGVGHWDEPDYISNNGILQVASVEKKLDIESTVTNVHIGFQTFNVQNITLAERESGVLQRNRNINLSISEFGVPSARTELGFNPIRQENISVTSTDATIARNLNVNLLPHQPSQRFIAMNVSRESTNQPSTLSINGLTVYVSHSVPFGTYGVVATGNAILDNDTNDINVRPATGGVRPLASTEAQFRRYAFSGLLFEPYIEVVTPGQGPNQNTLRDHVVVPHVEGNSFTVNGTQVMFTNSAGTTISSRNIGGSLYMPLRAVSEALGVEIGWVNEGQRITATAGGRDVIWQVGSSTMYINGMPRTMLAFDGTEVTPFLDNGLAATFLPVRQIVDAFGIHTVNVGGNVVINPTAAEAAQADNVVVQPEGYENGNGE